MDASRDRFMLQTVIMAGGSGTRFWPQSRREFPKQFLRMTGDETLIQQAASRCTPMIPSDNIWIVTGAAHAKETAKQLPGVRQEHILIEPIGRNTAPCIGLAAIQMLATDPQAIMLVMPADHVIRPIDEFQNAVAQAVRAIEDDPAGMVLFGIEPDFPSTGFGYIQRGLQVGKSTPPIYRVERFQEKPDLATASKLVASKEYFWNCGIFVWKAQTILDAIYEFEPEIGTLLDRLRPAIGTSRWQEVLNAEFSRMPSISIDYAVLERAADRVLVLAAPFEWDDVGSWHALPRLLETDGDGNTVDGLCCPVETEGCIVRSGGNHLIATIGVKDLIVVHTPTATLVASKHDENSLKRLIAEIERHGMTEFL